MGNFGKFNIATLHKAREKVVFNITWRFESYYVSIQMVQTRYKDIVNEERGGTMICVGGVQKHSAGKYD